MSKELTINERALLLNTKVLQKQSRSFAIPILKLDRHLLTPIMVEYNLNKTIDTIEDSLYLDADSKKQMIELFCDALSRGCISARLKKKMLEITPIDEHFVFQYYGSTIQLYNSLSKQEQEISFNRTIEMANGMSEFLDKKIISLKDLNQYCYYVAGTVGVFLTEILHYHHPQKNNDYEKLKENSIGFGLFLQKLNIIRDHTEDLQKNQGSYWPHELKEKYTDPIHLLNYMCHNTLINDFTKALQYFKELNQINESFENFIKFILYSGLEYIKILKNNKSILSKIKIKLPKLFITKLYQKVSEQTKEEFIDDCQNTFNKEIEEYDKLLYSI